ncbi:MAG: hypothetical protein AAB513_01695 [Patescibacteria group bacterium]
MSLKKASFNTRLPFRDFSQKLEKSLKGNNVVSLVLLNSKGEFMETVIDLWVLGAPDPEMEAIEKLLLDCSQTVVYAAASGKRVFAGNAYKADSTLPESGLDVERFSAWVECGFHGKKPEYIVDHHNPGDPGYGKGPSEFWQASSIGQVYQLLWNVAWENRLILKPTRDHIFTAAADHCLAHAYAGKCSTVDPEELLLWRIKSRAKFQGKSEELISAHVERARKAVRERAVETPFGLLADFGEETMPELLEASAREGIAFLGVGLPQRDGRRKKVLMGGSPEMISQWMATCGLKDVYGDPARGFAGGYLP